MSKFKKPSLPQGQAPLFPPVVGDYIGPLDRVRSLQELLGQGRFQRTFEKWADHYSRLGRRGYHPSCLAALYIYGWMEGVCSSRRLERACHNRIDFKWLMEGLTPDHSTISSFFKAHETDLDALFRDAIAVASEMKLVELKHVSVDGTTIGANASPSSVLKKSKIEELLSQCDKELQAYKAKLQKNEEQESLLPEPERPPQDEDDALRRLKERRAKMESTLKAIERRKKDSSRPSETSERGCITDPEARRLKGKRGHAPGPAYNMQIAVDSKAGIVLATDVSDRADDTGLLLPMVEQVRENTGSLPGEVSADKAYHVGPDLDALERLDVPTYIPENSTGKATTDESRAAIEALKNGEDLTEEQWKAVPTGANGKISRDAFIFDAENNLYICPKGETLVADKVIKDKQRCGVADRTQYRVTNNVCAACPIVDRCCSNPKMGRVVSRDQYEDTRERTRKRMSTDEGRKKYAQRMSLAETPSGMIKGNLGFRRFLRRGVLLAKKEALLITLAYNIRIITNALTFARQEKLLLDSG